ncbi:hypothetical protein VTN02DRAFT_1116 [Thermoascus thermophilus]
MEPTRKPNLRRSCHFCRSRKIRCSGESICNACRERNIECVYDLEASKGRPRGNSRTAQQAIPRTVEGEYFPPANDGRSTRSISRSDSPQAGFPLDDGLRADVDAGGSVAAELEKMFRENFGGDRNIPKINAYQERLAAFCQRITGERERSTAPDAFVQHPTSGPRGHLSYRGLLSLLTQDLVETLVTKFSNLGCQPFCGEEGRFFAVHMAQDRTATMFEADPAAAENPLAEYDSHRTTQLIDVWFTVHPLSGLISKTLLLRALRSNTHDEILLATILADAHFVAEDEASRARGKRLFDWAGARLSGRSAQQAGLSTAQALMLLGWHNTCLARVRRATCYVGYAGRVITRLKNRILETPHTGLSRINGIDVGEVEEEMIKNIWWMTFSLTLWSFIQMDMPFSDLLPTTVLSVFPPMDEESSVLIRLDKAADNLSTLRKQSATIREVWLLSHVTSTAAHLYATFPQPQEVTAAPPESLSWQAMLLQRLRSLHMRQTGIANLCADARDVLLHVVGLVKTKVEDTTSQVLMRTVYHTMLIHLLFPRAEPRRRETVVTERLMEDFITSAEELLNLFPIGQEMHRTASPVATGAPSPFPHSYVLGLDACGRAMDHFCTRFRQGTEAEGRILLDHISQLLELALAMHKLFKHDILLQDRRWRAVKKQLKSVRRRFEEWSGPGGHPNVRVGSCPSTDDSLLHGLSSTGTTSGSSAASPPPLQHYFGSLEQLEGLSPLLFDNTILPMHGAMMVSGEEIPFLDEDALAQPFHEPLDAAQHPPGLWSGFTSAVVSTPGDGCYTPKDPGTAGFAGERHGVKRKGGGGGGSSVVEDAAGFDGAGPDGGGLFGPNLLLNFGIPTGPGDADPVDDRPRKRARGETAMGEGTLFRLHAGLSRR